MGGEEIHEHPQTESKHEPAAEAMCSQMTVPVSLLKSGRGHCLVAGVVRENGHYRAIDSEDGSG